jgi:hypothetical protein
LLGKKGLEPPVSHLNSPYKLLHGVAGTPQAEIIDVQRNLHRKLLHRPH